MTEDQLRAECDRVLEEMLFRALEIPETNFGNLSVRGVLDSAREAIKSEASTFLKIHTMGEVSNLLVCGGFDINNFNWYDNVPFYRSSELEMRQEAFN